MNDTEKKILETKIESAKKAIAEIQDEIMIFKNKIEFKLELEALVQGFLNKCIEKLKH